MVKIRKTTVSTRMKMMAHFKGIINPKSGVATNAKPNPEKKKKKEPRKMISPAINKLDKSIVTVNPSQSATLTAPPEGEPKVRIN